MKHNYKTAEKSVFSNTDDKDLVPIEIPLPKCPPITKIDGYGKEPSSQVFEYQKYPDRLKTLEKRCGTINEVWDILNKNQFSYKDEIAWIKLQWYRRLNGYWFFLHILTDGIIST
jgi:hypothetical protein